MLSELIELLFKATEKQPALMFAWLIVGLLAVIAINNYLQIPYVVAIIGVCVLLMFIVIARLILLEPSTAVEKIAKETLVIFIVVAFIGTISVTVSAVVLHRPDIFKLGPQPESAASASASSPETASAAPPSQVAAPAREPEPGQETPASVASVPDDSQAIGVQHIGPQAISLQPTGGQTIRPLPDAGSEVQP